MDVRGNSTAFSTDEHGKSFDAKDRAVAGSPTAIKEKRGGPSALGRAHAISLVFAVGSLKLSLGLLGEMVGFTLGLGAGIAVGSLILARKRHLKVVMPQIKKLKDIDLTEDKRRELFLLIPQWVKNPDIERVGWLNRAAAKLWPYADKAIYNLFKNQIWPGVSKMLPGGLRIDFTEMTLGDLPLVIEGVEVKETVEDEIIFQMKVTLATNANVVADVRFFCLSTTVQVSEVQAEALVRITLKPLVYRLPCFESIHIELVDKPTIDFAATALGGIDFMSISSVQMTTARIVEGILSSILVWPKRLIVSLSEDQLQWWNKLSVGVLEVRILHTSDLKTSIFRTPQLYVRLFIREREELDAKTRVQPSANPTWNEKFQFTVKDGKESVLCMEVLDYHRISADTLMGTAEVSVGQLVPGAVTVMAPNLLRAANSAAAGKLHIEIVYQPLAVDDRNSEQLSVPQPFELVTAMEAAKNGDVMAVLPARSTGGGGLLSVTVHEARKLGDEHNGMCNPYCEIKLGDDCRRTRVMKKRTRVKWEEEFEFLLDGAPVGKKLLIEVYSKSTDYFANDKFLGRLAVDLSDVVRNGKLADIYQLHDVHNGSIRLEMMWQGTARLQKS
ncbi:hypothetical protein CBR_g20378 [Chara braunii]|uniref:C2 domain-containing protein n=1 Tax=Chara braunii TaxID=69332 RepID=A0A388JU79_CHABU|nr:hypothetical protein CBR_g20378 [Chara braunii]|eukprot:GBG61345.1 hypothetical protein CBR_g20378 [Chara braunii]